MLRSKVCNCTNVGFLIMVKKLGFGLLWLGFVVYAFAIAPPDRPDTLDLILKLSTGQWAGINAWVIMLFNLMGIWPFIYACLLLSDGRGQKIRAWPFALLSFGIGAFGLLPYFALRENNPAFAGKKDALLKLVDSRWLGILLSVAAIALLYYGFRFGDWLDFVQQWRTSRFIHVMTLDFCFLSLMFGWIVGDDMARRGLEDIQLFVLVSSIPLLGALVYLCIRPPLLEMDDASALNVES
jgi:hypothetical protein